MISENSTSNSTVVIVLAVLLGLIVIAVIVGIVVAVMYVKKRSVLIIQHNYIQYKCSTDNVARFIIVN